MPALHTSSERKGAIAACVLLIVAAAAVIWSSGAFRSEPVPQAVSTEAAAATVSPAEADSLLRLKESRRKSDKKERKQKKRKTNKKSDGGSYSRSHRDEQIN